MKLCICSLIKDEHPYIEEWIEYHHNLGFDKFYLFEDYLSESHKDIVKKYEYVKLFQIQDYLDNENYNIIINKNDTLQNQIQSEWVITYKLFNDLGFRKDNDWMAFISVDEYIDLSKEQLNEILTNSDKPMLSMIWKSMECNDHIHHPNNGKKYSVLKTYTNYNFNITQQKQLINCNQKYDNIFLSHKYIKTIPYITDGYYNDYEDEIFIKNFCFKSLEEYIQKVQKIYSNNYINFSLSQFELSRKLSDWFKINPKYMFEEKNILQEFNITQYD